MENSDLNFKKRLRQKCWYPGCPLCTGSVSGVQLKEHLPVAGKKCCTREPLVSNGKLEDRQLSVLAGFPCARLEGFGSNHSEVCRGSA